jgi:hypothetical protein
MATEHEETGNLDREMDETIRATLADINSRSEPDAQIPAEETTAEPVASEPENAGETPRDKQGKFVKGQVQRHQPAKSSAAQAEPTIPVTAPVPEPAAAEPSEPSLKFGAVEIDLKRPPSSWKPGAKAQWNALPEDVRKEVYRRETDFSNSVLNGPMKQNADFGQAIQRVVEPYKMLIEAEGGTPERAIADTMRTAALFRTGNQEAKLNALFAIDKQFNGGLRQHFEASVRAEVARLTGTQPQQQPQQPQQISDPRVDQIMKSLQDQERARTAEQERIANSATDQFLASKNDKGESKFPFVDNVIEDMTERVQAIRRANPALAHNDVLQQAYDAAVWANPETRAVLIAQQTAPQTAAAQTALKAAAARRATVGAMPKRGAIPATDPPKSLDDSIRDTGRELGMF